MASLGATAQTSNFPRSPEQPTKAKEPEVFKPPAEQEADEWKVKGNAFYKKREFAEAIEAYDKATEINPTNITYATNKAAVYLEMEDYDTCEKICKNLLDKRYEIKADFQAVAKVFNRLAASYTKQKRFQEALDMYEKSLCEDNNRSTRNLIKELQRVKDKTEIEAYQNPELAEEAKQRGNEHFAACRYPEAKTEYDEALKRNPADAKLYSNRAAAYTKLMALPDALKDCDKAISLEANFVKAHSRKGMVHLLMKEYNKALEAYQKGLSIDADNKECKEGIQEVLRKVQASQSSNEIDEEQVRHAMADPEVQTILRDPQMNLILKSMQENPASASEAMKDPKVAQAVQKLMMAGVLKIG
eukprot:Platyproteum_vivax@DN2813_c0_g1_i3.p1